AHRSTRGTRGASPVTVPLSLASGAPTSRGLTPRWACGLQDEPGSFLGLVRSLPFGRREINEWAQAQALGSRHRRRRCGIHRRGRRGEAFCARPFKEWIQKALGREGEAAEIKVGLTSIEILDVRISAPKGWPSDSPLRARRIVVVPDLRELLADRVRITSIEV